ncbi:MAG: Gfo/Idh/MocA family oxidoreductase [Promicromonosporaceae bacterium]|nr:Gfo/Idh/MocA family oxidoreductase [Promicromonosporaceae bacterium]
MAFPTSLPSPRTPDPKAAPPLNWGIIAPGGIAGAFAYAARELTRQNLVAVGSRSAERAREFAGKYGIPNVHDSYEALAADPQVNAVYVASPHTFHFEHAKLALEAGKPVLVEKSFTTDAAQAQQLADLAAAQGVALMEAMWTRFLPRTDIVRQLLEDGVLGELEVLIADHGQALLHIPRLVEPALAGGALLDLGIYPISWAVFALGLPGRVTAVGELLESGVDSAEAVILDQFGAHPDAQAVLQATIAAKTATTAVLSGQEARVELAGDFYTPGSVRLVDRSGAELFEPESGPSGHLGMAYEIAEFARVVNSGALESPLLPVAETVAIVEILDQVRAQIGVVYPWER